jgi:hypothetical protein
MPIGCSLKNVFTFTHQRTLTFLFLRLLVSGIGECKCHFNPNGEIVVAKKVRATQTDLRVPLCLNFSTRVLQNTLSTKYCK